VFWMIWDGASCWGVFWMIWDGASCPNRSHTPFSHCTSLYFYCKIWTLYKFLGLFLDHISASWNCNTY
jgi:hypothetical protein